MTKTRIVCAAAFVDGAPDDIQLERHDGQPVLHLGHTLTLHLEHASPELLFRLAGVLADTAAEKQATARSSTKAVA